MSTHNVSLFYALVGGKTVRIQEDGVGFWSPATAPINWCERDYAVSVFVAEFWNTVTNAAYVGVGVCAWMEFPRLPALRIAAACCVLTGLFSGLFHATLHVEHQRLDEIFENGILVFLCHDNAVVASAHFAVVAAAILSIESVRVCEIHLVSMIFFTIHRFLGIARHSPDAKRAIHTAALATAAGFACWLVDRGGCHYVSTPYLPYSLELHAWWHLCTAVALHHGFRAIGRLKSKCD
ncbi:Aste57867_9705 [Aphanomyces stellatus]|uniref:Aste57867_9705 protein n=1 Tax=Aphanomyces stellatus TaxID=120398 RepID=A0A485KNX3_9STRA|nr:hypothetical protein As57867_009667 [Aphanomyces stellatus]VFT86584.1 Aste57867_9705 [Aphanomyces stellatus]